MRTFKQRIGLVAVVGLVLAMAPAASAQTVLIDFGNQYETGNPAHLDQGNPTTGQPETYNNISVGGTTSRANATLGNLGTFALTNATGAATGWSIQLEAAGTTGVGDTRCNPGANVGDAPSAIKDNYAQTAWEDSLFCQDATLTVSITGLNSSQTYNLLLYGSRSNLNTSHTWSMTKGSGGGDVTHGSANNTTTVVDWTDISPDGTGEIEFTLTTTAATGALNFGSITANAAAATPGTLIYGK